MWNAFKHKFEFVISLSLSSIQPDLKCFGDISMWFLLLLGKWQNSFSFEHSCIVDRFNKKSTSTRHSLTGLLLIPSSTSFSLADCEPAIADTKNIECEWNSFKHTQTSKHVWVSSKLATYSASPFRGSYLHWISIYLYNINFDICERMNECKTANEMAFHTLLLSISYL